MADGNKIVFFISGLRPGGIGKVILNLSKGFIDRGFQVDILVTRDAEAYFNDIHPSIKVINFNTGRVIKSIIPLARYLKQNQPKAFISANDYVNLVAIWAWKLSKVSTKMIATIHIDRRSIKMAGNLKNHIFRFLACRTYPLADHIIAVSKGVADNAALLFKLPYHLISVIHNPIVDDSIMQKAGELVPHDWLIKKECPVIIGAGRLTKQKDFQTLIRAFQIVRTQRPAKLIILGAGEEKDALQNLTMELKVEDDVSFTGFVVNPYAYLGSAELFVLSSTYEGFGNVIVEAMATGTTVVATDCPSGPAEILEQGKYGYLTPVGDSEAMAKAICEGLDNPVSDELLKKRAADFSIGKITDEYMNLIELN